MEIGEKVKKLRMQKKLTLRDLGDRTDLSIGFLSQFERGLTSIAVDSLTKIAEALDTDLSTFLSIPTSSKDNVIRSYNQTISLIESNQFLHTYLSKQLSQRQMFPELITILPSAEEKDRTQFSHEGEEFLYVLEGILTLSIDSERYQLYPGDSIHFSSKGSHNWYNATNMITKLLVVHLPNPFHE